MGRWSSYAQPTVYTERYISIRSLTVLAVNLGRNDRTDLYDLTDANL
jgi:hypothetical protein